MLYCFSRILLAIGVVVVVGLSDKDDKTLAELGECSFDQGGYFVINGRYDMTAISYTYVCMLLIYFTTMHITACCIVYVAILLF